MKTSFWKYRSIGEMNERSWRRKYFIGTGTSYISSSDDAQQIPRNSPATFLNLRIKLHVPYFPPSVTQESTGRLHDRRIQGTTYALLIAKNLDRRESVQDKTRHRLDRRQAVSFVKALQQKMKWYQTSCEGQGIPRTLPQLDIDRNAYYCRQMLL